MSLIYSRYQSEMEGISREFVSSFDETFRVVKRSVKLRILHCHHWASVHNCIVQWKEFGRIIDDNWWWTCLIFYCESIHVHIDFLKSTGMRDENEEGGVLSHLLPGHSISPSLFCSPEYIQFQAFLRSQFLSHIQATFPPFSYLIFSLLHYQRSVIPSIFLSHSSLTFTDLPFTDFLSKDCFYHSSFPPSPLLLTLQSSFSSQWMPFIYLKEQWIQVNTLPSIK